MSKALFIFNILILFTLVILSAPAIAAEGKRVIITSHTLTADNKNNIAVFEGSVIAKSEDFTILSDRMEVSYNNTQGEVTKVYAYGNVKAIKDNRTIFSKEATYSGEEGKIVFTGEPRAVDGENVIAGNEIIYFLKQNRTIVKGSRVILKKRDN
ncbi:MAG: hypothetical protein HY758_05525 [Nitrospirae bacterium]|nr:hypothetical protein [Nitrospirota bacterium]